MQVQVLILFNEYFFKQVLIWFNKYFSNKYSFVLDEYEFSFKWVLVYLTWYLGLNYHVMYVA